MICALVRQSAQAQDFDDLLETIYHQCTKETVYEVLQERLWEYYQHPIPLYEASREALQHLGILTDEQLNQLFQHMEKNGPLISIYELQVIPGFDLQRIQLLRPFVRITKNFPQYAHQTGLTPAIREKFATVLWRHERTLETKQGYKYNYKQQRVPYLGSPNKLFVRISISHPNQWELGLSAKKDAGEPLGWDPITQCYGPLLWRFHWKIKNPTYPYTLLIGDYAVGYGQGLVLHAGLPSHKSADVIQVIRTNHVGICPHTAMSTAAFKGIAATWHGSPITLAAYYSNKNLDGKIHRKVYTGHPYVESVTRSSTYRTLNEMAKQGTVNEQVLGSTLVYQFPIRDTTLGMNLLYSRYSLPIYPRINPHPNKFQGQHHANGSLFFRYLWRNFHVFGEGAVSKNGAKAAIVGVVASLSRTVDTTLLVRHYGQRFHRLYGKAFGENAASNRNEQGIYVGMKSVLTRHVHLSIYGDFFRFPQYLDGAQVGYSWLAQITHQPIKHMRICLTYKNTTKPRQAPQQRTVIGTRQHYKVTGQYTLRNVLRLQSDVQCSHYQKRPLCSATWGYAIIQRVYGQLWKLQWKGLVARFNAKDFHNSFYVYEPNATHVGNYFRAYHGNGIRCSGLLVYRTTANTKLTLRYTHTQYKDAKTIGSGYETIQGNKKNELLLQLFVQY